MLRAVTEAHGFTLAPRLTVYPEFALDPERWLDPAMRFPVLDRSDAEGLGRDDPGAALARAGQRHAANVGDGAEVVLVGGRSTAWYSGRRCAPPVLVPAPAAAGGAVAEVLAGVRAGQQPGEDELVTLFGARGPEVAAVAALADELRADAVGDTVTWVHNRNINYTNVCTFKCRFCGFSKGPLSLNLRGKPYLLTLDDIAEPRRARRGSSGATEVCLQGGIHPSFDGDFYVDVARAVKAAAPDIHVHGFTALEVTEGARRLGEPLETTCRLQGRRADSPARHRRGDPRRRHPGGPVPGQDHHRGVARGPRDRARGRAALQRHDHVRRGRAARALGPPPRADPRAAGRDRRVHRVRRRCPFVHMAAPIYLKRGARRGPTWREVVLMHAVARIAYHGLIDNIQASWVKLGADGARQLLQAGVNDLGGTLMDENISRAAGAAHGQAHGARGLRRARGAARATARPARHLVRHPRSLRLTSIRLTSFG